jgi:hypothetical protein
MTTSTNYATAPAPGRFAAQRATTGASLPRHAFIYLLIIALLSLFQIALGANFVVLLAIDAVCVFAIYPMTRKAFGATDMLFLSFCFYYGTFSLFLKCMVLQPVQENLVVPYITCSYLVVGFFGIFLSYYFVERTMTRHYPRTTLRRWNLFEKRYADERFLTRFTLPLSIIAIAFTVLISVFSHSVQDVANGQAASGGFAALGALEPIIQLAFAMQLSLLTRRGTQTDRALVFATITIAVAISIFNNQKVLAMTMGMTYVLHAIAYRIRIRPRLIALGLLGGAIAFLYLSPLIHIVRGLEIDKSQRISETIRILEEANFNPFELMEIDKKLQGSQAENTFEAQIDYLSPYNLSTDRFTMLMPIDQMARAGLRAPLGFMDFLLEIRDETLPKQIIGEHRLEVLGDMIAWRYTIRGNGIIARPTLGVLGTGFGVAGVWGLMVLAPLISLIFFATIKLISNGSIWHSPWAVFIASYVVFDGEVDLTIVVLLLRGLLPLLIVAALVIVYDRAFDKNIPKQAIG